MKESISGDLVMKTKLHYYFEVFLFAIANGSMYILIKTGLIKCVIKFSVKHSSAPRRRRKAFRGYTPTEHDVLVCTYGKSGTNWALQVVTQIAHYGKAEFDFIHSIVPWAEVKTSAIVGLHKPTWESSPVKIRAIKTHHEAEYVPYNGKAKYLVIFRDPKDAMVSSYHFVGSLFHSTKHMSFYDWVELFKEENSMFGSWPHHMASFWDWRNRDNVLILSFDEMKRDLGGCVKEIAKLMAVNLTEEQLNLVIYKSNFAYMKKINHKFIPKQPGYNPDKINGPVMVRKGQSGSAAKLLSDIEIKEIDEILMRQLEDRGSDFPYREYFCPQE